MRTMSESSERDRSVVPPKAIPSTRVSKQEEEDLEDGEIEDDEDEEHHRVPIHVPPPMAQPPPKFQQALESLPLMVVTQDVPKVEPKSPMAPTVPLVSPLPVSPDMKYRKDKKRHEKKHLTEAEKSVMRLHKLERIEREKHRREQQQVLHPPVEQEEDFATSLEKAIAKVLKKDKPPSEDEKVEEPQRGKKRKKKDKHNKKKKGKMESPSEEFEDIDMLNVRSGSPEPRERTPTLPGSLKSDEETWESESSPERSPEDQQPRTPQQKQRKNAKRQFDRNNPGNPGNQGNRKFRDRSHDRSRDREKRVKAAGKRNTGVCLYYLQGLCDDDNCQYSHEIVQPMKLELCKFYLLDCCAKGDKCLYMHSDFPCKFYHTGIPCPYGDGCKFAHGGPLSDALKQILFKHIETAPKEILGNFPRLSRENASIMIIQAQKNLEGKYGPLKKDKDHHQHDNGGNRNDVPSLFDMGMGFGQDQGDDMRQGDGKKENKRNRPSRWQDPDPIDKANKGSPEKQKHMNMGFPMKGAYKDQDMRFNSNGDVDMRTMPMNQQTIHSTNIVNPNILAQKPPPQVMQPNLLLPNLLPALLQQSSSGSPLQGGLGQASGLLNQHLLDQGNSPMRQGDMNLVDIEKYKMEAAGMVGSGGEMDMLEAAKKDTDIRHFDLAGRSRDSDIRMLHKHVMSTDDEEMESGLQIVMEDEDRSDELKPSVLETLPRTQRELFKRIQAQQKEKLVEDTRSEPDNDNDANIDWYSDDEDDNKLTIKDDYEEARNEDEPKVPEPGPVKPLEVMEKLGDLSKIDISAEVTKLLSTMSQQGMNYGDKTSEAPKDPRQSSEQRDPRLSTETRETRAGEARDPRLAADPRRARNSSVEERAIAVSIYDQGFVSDVGKDVDLRSSSSDLRFAESDFRAGGRPDVDLRQLNLPFKGMQNYTPASEIDASINSHPHIPWKVCLVEIPKPDYTGLKLSSSEAQTTGDPRLRKIFRLSVEEKDSPASPKETVKPAVARVDPRRKKLEAEQSKPMEPSSMTYTQQLSMLQSSPFYQTLTSNQKLMLNQELASRNDQSGQSDPIIGAMLQNLGLVSPANQNSGGQSQALHILANVNSLGFPPNAGPMMPMGPMGNPQNIGQGLLGPAPNMPPDFPIGFDPRNGPMMGNGPQFGNFPPEGNNFGGFNDDFYPDQGSFNNNQGNNNRENNRGFRDRQRRGRMNNRNNRSFFRRHNRNRNSSPP